MTMKDRVRQIGTFVGIIGGIMLDSTRFRGGRLGDSDIGEISDRTNTLITPADGPFSSGTFVGVSGGIMLDSTRFRGGRLGDSDIGEISDRTNTLITPADGTFTIW